MDKRRARSLLAQLAKVLMATYKLRDSYSGSDLPHVKFQRFFISQQERCWGLLWVPGPFEWSILVSGGECAYAEELAPELGRRPEQPAALKRVLETIKEAGFYLEPITGSVMGIGEI
ncbi:MAG: hypothetical protein V3S01_05590 [Dehalococcoidia bacterium]